MTLLLVVGAKYYINSKSSPPKNLFTFYLLQHSPSRPSKYNNLHFLQLPSEQGTMPRLKQPLYDESSWRMQVGFEQANPSIEMWIESSVNQGGEPKLHVYRDRTKTRGHASVVAHIDVDTCPDELRKPDGKFSTTKAHEMWRAHFRFRLQHYRIVGIRAEGLTSNDIQARGGEEYLERTITGIGMPANKSPHGQKTLNKKHDEGEDKEEEEMPIAASDGIVEAQKGSHSTLQASAIPKQKPSDHVPVRDQISLSRLNHLLIMLRENWLKHSRPGACS